MITIMITGFFSHMEGGGTKVPILCMFKTREEYAHCINARWAV